VPVIATHADGPRVRIKLAIGGAAEGALLDASSGAALANVMVTGSGPNGLAAETLSDKNGQWKLGPLKPGHWRIAAKQSGYVPIAREVDVTPAHAPGAATIRDIRLELVRGALVGGTVRDATGHRVPGAHVIARAGAVTAEAETDAQGEFRIKDCPAGDLEVAAAKGDSRGVVTAIVRPADELLGLSIDLH
jgi:hypothetical protein